MRHSCSCQASSVCFIPDLHPPPSPAAATQIPRLSHREIAVEQAQRLRRDGRHLAACGATALTVSLKSRTSSIGTTSPRLMNT